MVLVGMAGRKNLQILSYIKVFAAQDGRLDDTTDYINPHVTHWDQTLVIGYPAEICLKCFLLTGD